MSPLKAGLVVFGLVLSMALLSATEAHAGISQNNPYRSFNISGINYGSQQWERSRSSSKSSTKRGFYFRSRGWR